MIKLFLLLVSALLPVLLFVCYRIIKSKNREIILLNKQKDKFQELYKKEKDLNGKKDELFSVIGHDLNTSMTSLHEIVELLDPQNTAINKIEKQKLYNHLQTITRETFVLFRNLIYWSDIQFNELEVVNESFKLSESIEKMLFFFGYILKSKNIEMEIEGKKDIVVYSDRIALEIILLNLLHNALKFTPSGGKVTLLISENSTHCSLAVNDSGDGIPDDILENIFDFGKTKPGYGTDNEKGVGLGLINCKSLAQKLGGEIHVEKEKNPGSKFSFTFPL